MARYNLLKTVQRIGVAIGSDEISELDENDEVHDIQVILEDTFNFILKREQWEFTKNQLTTLAADASFAPRLMIPDTVQRMSWQYLKYRDHKVTDRISFVRLEYVSPEEFVERVNARNSSDAENTVINNENGVPLVINTESTPSYYTSFDETHIWFDSYDSNIASGSVAPDTLLLGDVLPTMDWETATATFPVPEQLEELIRNEAIAMASVELRQIQHPRAERRARTMWNRCRYTLTKVHEDRKEIDYGRK